MGKQCQTLFLGGSKITADGDCSHEIKRRLLLGGKTMISLNLFPCSWLGKVFMLFSSSKYHLTNNHSSITADGNCSHEIKRRLRLGRKVMTNLDSILKSRNITLPTKVRLVKAMVFRVVMYGCESWTVKKAERRRIDAFELWCWRRLLRVPWTARR